MNSVDCTVDVSCATLSRELCSKTPRTCGECLVGYIGLIGTSSIIDCIPLFRPKHYTFHQFFLFQTTSFISFIRPKFPLFLIFFVSNHPSPIQVTVMNSVALNNLLLPSVRHVQSVVKMKRSMKRQRPYVQVDIVTQPPVCV